MQINPGDFRHIPTLTGSTAVYDMFSNSSSLPYFVAPSHLFNLVYVDDGRGHDPGQLEGQVQHERHLLARVPPRDRVGAQVYEVRARAMAGRVSLKREGLVLEALHPILAGSRGGVPGLDRIRRACRV
jgi:hypothetical protein